MSESIETGRRYIALKVELKDLDAKVKKLKEELADEGKQVITALVNDKITGVDIPYGGRTYHVGVKRGVKISLAGGQGVDAVKQALIEKAQLGDIVKPTCNAATFKAVVRETLEGLGVTLDKAEALPDKIIQNDAEIEELGKARLDETEKLERRAHLLAMKPRLEAIAELASFYTDVDVSVTLKPRK